MVQDAQVRRDRLFELEHQLHVSMGTPPMEAVREYCKLQYEEVKEELVGCSDEEFKRLQGVAETYYTIVDRIENVRDVGDETGE